jgi:hypothetical protein
VTDADDSANVRELPAAHDTPRDTRDFADVFRPLIEPLYDFCYHVK